MCTHRWLIEPAAGLESTGTCRLCGESREFANWLDVDYGVSHSNLFGKAGLPPSHRINNLYDFSPGRKEHLWQNVRGQQA